MRRSLLATIAAVSIAAGTSACGGGGAPPAQAGLASDGGTPSSTTVAVISTSTLDATESGASPNVAEERDAGPVAPRSSDQVEGATGEGSDGPGETDAGQSDPATSAGTVAAWVAALAAGDTDRAWELTHVASRDAFGGRDAFEASASELAESYGAWAEAADIAYEVTPVPAAGPGVDIVALRGTIGRDGAATVRVEAIPVRQDADKAHQVDPFQDLLGEAGLEHQPPDGASISSTHEFAVVLVAMRNVSFIADDEVLNVESEGADGDRQRVTGRPRQPLGAGVHAFTVVIERDGAVQTQAALYEVG
jgi:hypothetical protein